MTTKPNGMTGTIELKMQVVEEKAGFIGAIFSGNRDIFISDHYKTLKRAERATHRAVMKMIRCSHEINIETDVDPYPVDCDSVGNEIFGWSDTCPLCGYIDHLLVEEIE